MKAESVRDEVTDKRGYSKRRVYYQHEYVRCGTAGCHCQTGGDGHGPYWFAYWKNTGVKKKRYIGAALKKFTFEQLRAFERSDDRKKSRRRAKKAAAE